VDAIYLYVGIIVFWHHDVGNYRSMRQISEIVLGINPSITTTLVDGSDERTSTLSEWEGGEEDCGVFEDARLYNPSAHPEVRFTALAMLCPCVL